MKKERGIFEHPLGSDCWRIQYFDSEGRRRREKAGTKSNAKKLLIKEGMRSWSA